MNRILFVFGTRPETIKLAPLVHELGRRPGLEPIVCATGQHRHMLDQALGVFGISPDFDLGVMTENQDLFDLTAAALGGLKGVLDETRPDMVVVQGDTTTALAGALAAYYRQVPLAHVEAGLRTWDKYSPFPEEINRAVVDVVADLCFAPTDRARENLLRTGVPADRIIVTGNTVIDALLWVKEGTDKAEQGASGHLDEIPAGLRAALQSGSGTPRLLLVTGHRRESFGPDLEAICVALGRVAEQNPDVVVAYPVHLNPNVRGPVFRILGETPRVHLFDPPGYLGFVWLLARCYLVLTDSGGIQEEAPALGKPVLVTRRVTERPEGVDAGCARVVGVETSSIVESVEALLRDEDAYQQMSAAKNPYGDGRASARIADAIESWLLDHD